MVILSGVCLKINSREKIMFGVPASGGVILLAGAFSFLFALAFAFALSLPFSFALDWAPIWVNLNRTFCPSQFSQDKQRPIDFFTNGFVKQTGRFSRDQNDVERTATIFPNPFHQILQIDSISKSTTSHSCGRSTPPSRQFLCFCLKLIFGDAAQTRTPLYFPR